MRDFEPTTIYDGTNSDQYQTAMLAQAQQNHEQAMLDLQSRECEKLCKICKKPKYSFLKTVIQLAIFLIAVALFDIATM